MLSWAVDRGESELGLRIAGALRWFWFARGYFGEGRRWLEGVLRNDGQTAAKVKALIAMSLLAHQQGDIDEAESAAEEGRKLSARIEIEGDLLVELRGLLGSAAEVRGDYERAAELFEEGVALGRETGNSWGVAFNLNCLGGVWVQWEDYERATEFFEESLALLQDLGDVAHSALVLTGLGSIALEKGDYDRATALSEEAVALFREQEHVHGIEGALCVLGWAALLRDDHERARASYEESIALCREQGDRWTAIGSLEGLACFAATKEKPSGPPSCSGQWRRGTER